MDELICKAEIETQIIENKHMDPIEGRGRGGEMNWGIWIDIYTLLMKVKCERVSHSVELTLCNSLQPHGLEPTRLLCPWNSPGKNTGVGCHSLPQGIFPKERSNPGLPHVQEDSLPFEPPGKPIHY